MESNAKQPLSIDWDRTFSPKQYCINHQDRETDMSVKGVSGEVDYTVYLCKECYQNKDYSPPKPSAIKIVKCPKCFMPGSESFVSHSSRYGAGTICQRCADKETVYKR